MYQQLQEIPDIGSLQIIPVGMFKKLVNKVIMMRRSRQNADKISAQQFRQKCLNITKQYPILQSSLFFTTHLPLLFQQHQILPALGQKIALIHEGIINNPQIQMQLASIVLSIIQQDGFFFMFVKLWLKVFCEFELQKIVNEFQTLDQQSPTNTNPKCMKQKSEKIQKFFHKEYFLLCFFIYQLTLSLYSECLSKEKNQNRELFLLIRNTITSVRDCQSIHEIFRVHVNCEKINFNEEEIQKNMMELDEICLITKIPAPFLESMNLLNQFCKIAEIDKKLKKSTILIQKIKQEMQQYRQINELKKDYVFCADDVLSALTFVMWRLRKNIYGPCIYVETLLCCQYAIIEEQRLAEELDKFGQVTRHSFDTLRSVSRIGLLDAQKIYSLS